MTGLVLRVYLRCLIMLTALLRRSARRFEPVSRASTPGLGPDTAADRSSGQWWWFDPVYRCSHVLFVCEADEIATRLDLLCAAGDMADQFAGVVRGIVTEGLVGNCGGKAGRHVSAVRQGFQVGIIWLRPRFLAGTLAHEAFHAACVAVGGSGVVLTDDSEEAFAYYVEYVVNECERRISAAEDGETETGEAAA